MGWGICTWDGVLVNRMGWCTGWGVSVRDRVLVNGMGC